jgi:molybdopterin-binding protein
VIDSGGKSSARNRLPADIRDVNVMVALARVNLDCGFPLVAYITLASAEELGLTVGKQVTAVVKATAIHVM